MNVFSLIQQSSFLKRLLCALTAFFFFGASIFPNPTIAQTIPTTILNLPIPGSVVATTAGFAPAMIKGINLYPDNPLKFDFIIDKGDAAFTDEEFKKESTRLIKYFLSSLTVPEDEMWVNLSPYEKNRIVPQDFGKTEMGRDLLAQDYMLKQLTASLMNPDDKLGGEFWQRVYSKAQEKYGTTDIPMNTFNKIWIVPEKAVVYEHEKGAFVVKSHLKVMLEEDYLALEANKNSTKHGLGDVKVDDLKVVSGVQSAIIKDLLIPEIEREVNEGQTFANLRQIYNAVILASWYKQALKESLLGQVYIDQKKTKGVETEDKIINEQIYNQYVESFKKGIFNYIKEDYNPETQEVVKRKYFSGGIKVDMESLATKSTLDLSNSDLASVAENSAKVEVDMASLSSSEDTNNQTKIDKILNQIEQLSPEDFNKKVHGEDIPYQESMPYVDSKIIELFFIHHTQESFDLTVEKLRGLWETLKLDQSRGIYVGLEFENGVAYYMAEIEDKKILEKNVGFLVNTTKIQNAEELIARFGTELVGHLSNLTPFHFDNQAGGYFVDNRLLPKIIEGFIRRMKKEDLELDGTPDQNREVLLNLYFLLSLINPNIYPDKTYDDGQKKANITYPKEATWENAMDTFERVFIQQFDQDKYLSLLEKFESPKKLFPPRMSVPWSFNMVRGIEEFKLGFSIEPGKFYGFRHPDVNEGFTKVYEYNFKKRNAQVNELLNKRIARMKNEIKSDAKGAGNSNKRLKTKAAATPGGIDLNPTILSTEINRTGRGVIIPAFKGVVPDLNGMEGFVPNIINVTPITNLQLLLGLDTKSNESPSSPKNEKPVGAGHPHPALSLKKGEEGNNLT